MFERPGLPPGPFRVQERRVECWVAPGWASNTPLRSIDVTPRRVDPAAEPATLDAMDVVMQQAYGAWSFADSIQRFVAAQPDGLVVVEEGGDVVGTGCCIAYQEGGFGWIG